MKISSTLLAALTAAAIISLAVPLDSFAITRGAEGEPKACKRLMMMVMVVEICQNYLIPTDVRMDTKDEALRSCESWVLAMCGLFPFRPWHSIVRSGPLLCMHACDLGNSIVNRPSSTYESEHGRKKKQRSVGSGCSI